MNLLELMLKEELEWPAVAEFAAQDGDDGVVYFYSIPPIKYEISDKYWVSNGVSYVGKKNVLALSEDWSSRIITREEYQAAGGWMKWEGGECPVDWCEFVEHKMRDGGQNESRASILRWNHDLLGTGKHNCGDIVCYRIIKQTSVQLDNPKIEPGFEPFVSIEDAQEYKAEHAATSKQSSPKGSGNPILGMVLADLTNRALEGREKYGEPLKAHNGRNALWDAYQEALDLAMYLRQLIEEQCK